MRSIMAATAALLLKSISAGGGQKGSVLRGSLHMHLSCLIACGRLFVHVELGSMALKRAYRQQATL